MKHTRIAKGGMTIGLWAALMLAFFFTAMPPTPAYAQCLPGVPCVTPKTQNDPLSWPISPNDGGPNANKTTSDACDADFMNQIYARAFIEAERQNVMNKILIRKPDSTLEYSCFEQPVSMTAVDGGPLFTETDYWHNRDITIDGRMGDGAGLPPGGDYISTRQIDTYMGDTKLDVSLQTLILQALKKYVDTEFFHDYLGGSAVGLNNDITGGISGYYFCNFIDSVHFLAKCEDFATDDQFFSFETLANFDPRLYPKQCGGTAITQDIINVANNKDYQYADFDKVTATYLDRMDPNACSAPIPTGLRVFQKTVTYDFLGNERTQRKEFDEFTCSNPGCTYNPDKKRCEQY